MRDLTAALLLALCLASTMFRVPIVSTSVKGDRPKTWIVPIDFPNITSAIQSPDVLDGDTILVLRNPNDPEGAYREGTIGVVKSLNIIADNRWGRVIINGTWSVRLAAIRIDADNVTIKGFIITNAYVGISIGEAANCLIDSNRILQCWIGVQITGYASNCMISNNIIELNKFGIKLVIGDPAREDIYGCYQPIYMPTPSVPKCIEIKSNLIRENDVGIALGGGEAIIINENRIDENNCGIGIGCCGFVIENNILKYNWLGIEGYGCGFFLNNTLVGNRFCFSFPGHPLSKPVMDVTNKVNNRSIVYLADIARKVFIPR